MKALVLGATGLTGGLLVEQLIDDNRYSEITILGRTPCGFKHEKIKEVIGDLFHLDTFESHFDVDHVYCCIGTTRKKTPDQTVYHAIDVGIPIQAAELSKRNGVQVFVVISAIGAAIKSRFAYNRMKGEMEEGVMRSQIDRTYILRPSLIIGPRKEHRTGEGIASILFRALRFVFIGKLKRYRAVEAKDIAACMIRFANSKLASQIVESDQIA